VFAYTDNQLLTQSAKQTCKKGMFVAAIASLCCTQANSNELDNYIDNYDAVGKAYNAQQELLYTEHYSFENHETLVVYKSPEGKVLAAKSLSYAGLSHYRPDITIYQHRDKTTYTLNNHAKYIQLSATDADQNQQTIRKTKARKNLVIDAAFDHYIKDNWQHLKSQAKNIAFALAQHGKIYDVVISQSEDKHCQRISQHCFSITPDNWLFALIAGSTVIGYDDHKRLQYFNGPSNSIAQKSRERVSVFYTHLSDNNGEQVAKANY